MQRNVTYLYGCMHEQEEHGKEAGMLEAEVLAARMVASRAEEELHRLSEEQSTRSRSLVRIELVYISASELKLARVWQPCLPWGLELNVFHYNRMARFNVGMSMEISLCQFQKETGRGGYVNNNGDSDSKRLGLCLYGDW